VKTENNFNAITNGSVNVEKKVNPKTYSEGSLKMQKLMKAIHKNENGFTLVELMVVVVIIGVLVAIAIPIYNNVTARAQEGACQANLRTIDGAITMAGASTAAADTALFTNGVYTGTLKDLETNGYLQDEPQCPTAIAVYTIVAGRTVCPNTPAHTYP
jgi:prepilin-type N-terminal cleavage/methylation domain-containing protein